MPVTFDNGDFSASTGVALQFTLTVTTEAVLLAMIAADGADAGVSVSAVAYGGAPLTRLFRIEGVGAGRTVPFEIWGLTAPAAGANVLSAQFNGSDLWRMTGLSYVKATAADPFGTASGATGTNISVVNLSISSTSTDLVVFGFISSQRLTFNSSATARVSDASAQWRMGDMSGNAGPTTTASLSLSVGGFVWGGGLSLRFSAASVVTPGWLSLVGVGR